MAQHVRTTLRKAFLAALDVAELAHVKRSEARAYPYSALPAIGVYTRSEAIAEEGRIMGDALAWRVLTVSVEIREKAPEAEWPGALDLISADVEAAIDADTRLGKDAVLVESTFEVELLEQPVGVLVMNFEVPYRLDPADPLVDLSP